MAQGSPSSFPRQATVLFDGQIVKGPGAEWHSTPISVPADHDLTMEARSSSRFYAGIFDEANYQRLRRIGGPTFPFRFGQDQVAFSVTKRALIDDQYRIVLRVGIFAGQRATIQLRIIRTD